MNQVVRQMSAWVIKPGYDDIYMIINMNTKDGSRYEDGQNSAQDER